MKNLKSFFVILILSGLTIYLFSCDEGGVGPQADFISGTITFVVADTNRIHKSGGYYAVSLFPNRANPFCNKPVRSDSLRIERSGTNFGAYYKMEKVAAGTYYVGVSWVRIPATDTILPVLGTYGCNVNYNCTDYKQVQVPSAAGTGNINFQSLLDTNGRFNSCPRP